jgi:hypothetical protein
MIHYVTYVFHIPQQTCRTSNATTLLRSTITTVYKI